MSDKNLFEISGLKKHFPIRKGVVLAREVGRVRAVDGLEFTIRKGETLGLVGESGSGKTTTGRLLAGLLAASEGQIRFKGEDISRAKKQASRQFRREVQVIFQDPFSSLDPRMTVERIVAEPLIASTNLDRRARRTRVVELLDRVGLARSHAARYPHQFSGGQRQRIGIARALALSPSFVVCDEPVSALDVSIQGQIINLLRDLQSELGLTYLFVAHDLSVVRHISDRVAVMYLGKFVELAPKRSLYASPLHPYTQALLAAAPSIRHRRAQNFSRPQGELPSPINPPSGCPFHPRCPRAVDACKTDVPPLREIFPGHFASCHLVG